MKRTLDLLIIPSVLWLLVFFVVPFILIFYYSFLERGTYGELLYNFNIESYIKLYDPIYLSAFLKSFTYALINSVLCLILGYPMAYYLVFTASDRSKLRIILLLMIILPFLTNYVARSYSWLFLLSGNGIINDFLITIGLIHEPINLIFTPFAIVVGLAYNYLPFMTISLYSHLMGQDKRLILAAYDLGATNYQTFTKVIIPISKKGIINGLMIVFAFSIADYIIPNLLGGSKYLLISNVIANQFIVSRNVPLGSSLTIIFLISIFILFRLFMRKGKGENE